MRPMRWWDIAPVMALEHELFGDEAWTDSMFWSELAERDAELSRLVHGDVPLVYLDSAASSQRPSQPAPVGVSGEAVCQIAIDRKWLWSGRG